MTAIGNRSTLRRAPDINIKVTTSHNAAEYADVLLRNQKDFYKLNKEKDCRGALVQISDCTSTVIQ